MTEYTSLAEKFEALRPVLSELARRRWAATEALACGRGGISAVARATGLSRKTIRAGIRELRSAEGAAVASESTRLRRPGAGRKRRATQDPTLLRDLETLVEPTTRGDPQSPLRWTCKSVRRLALELQAQGHQVSPQLVSELLHGAGYSLQGTRKTREGAQHPDRNAQFEQTPRNSRRNLLPMKCIHRSLVMRHEYLACALVEPLEIGKTSSGADGVLHHPPEAFKGVEVVPTMGG